MANVTILSLLFPPDPVSTAQLIGDIAADLQREGHRVSVVTTTPHYNAEAAKTARRQLRPVFGRLLYGSDHYGVSVLHVRMGAKQSNLLARLPGWLYFHAAALILLLSTGPRPQVVIVPSPLLSLGVVGWLGARLRGARLVYSVFELYPDLAIHAGILRNGLLIKFFRALERFVYRNSYAVVATSPGLQARVQTRTTPSEKVVYIPNFADVRAFLRTRDPDGFRAEIGLHGKFVVTYAGNIGPMQGLDVLLDAAEHLQSDSSVAFVFVGTGTSAASLQATAGKRRLRNVIFVPHQPYERVPDIYEASDILVAALVGSIGADAVPSKVYGMMAARRPVLAIAETGSELAAVIRAAGAGAVVSPRDATAVADAIRELRNQSARSSSMTDNGWNYVTSHCTREKVSAAYGALVDAAADGGVAPAHALAALRTHGLPRNRAAV